MTTVLFPLTCTDCKPVPFESLAELEPNHQICPLFNGEPCTHIRINSPELITSLGRDICTTNSAIIHFFINQARSFLTQQPRDNVSIAPPFTQEELAWAGFFSGVARISGAYQEGGMVCALELKKRRPSPTAYSPSPPSHSTTENHDSIPKKNPYPRPPTTPSPIPAN